MVCRVMTRLVVIFIRVGFGIGESMLDADIVMGYAVGTNVVVGMIVT